MAKREIQAAGGDGATFADVVEELQMSGAYADVLEDHALRMTIAQPNCDPMLLTVARETAVELLADYLEHVRLNAAARRILKHIAGSAVIN